MLSWIKSPKKIKRSAKTIRFDQYEVAPYAMGPVVVEIPYDEIADILYPGGIIEKIIGLNRNKK